MSATCTINRREFILHVHIAPSERMGRSSASFVAHFNFSRSFATIYMWVSPFAKPQRAGKAILQIRPRKPTLMVTTDNVGTPCIYFSTAAIYLALSIARRRRRRRRASRVSVTFSRFAEYRFNVMPRATLDCRERVFRHCIAMQSPSDHFRAYIERVFPGKDA